MSKGFGTTPTQTLQAAETGRLRHALDVAQRCKGSRDQVGVVNWGAAYATSQTFILSPRRHIQANAHSEM